MHESNFARTKELFALEDVLCVWNDNLRNVELQHRNTDNGIQSLFFIRTLVGLFNSLGAVSPFFQDFNS